MPSSWIANSWKIASKFLWNCLPPPPLPVPYGSGKPFFKTFHGAFRNYRTINLLIRRRWASYCAIIGFQLLVQNKLFPSFSFSKRTVETTVHCKILRICIKNRWKTYKRFVTSVSYISLNLNFHIPYKMLIIFNSSYFTYLKIFDA